MLFLTFKKVFGEKFFYIGPCDVKLALMTLKFTCENFEYSRTYQNEKHLFGFFWLSCLNNVDAYELKRQLLHNIFIYLKTLIYSI